jgi:hypothetical protein
MAFGLFLVRSNMSSTSSLNSPSSGAGLALSTPEEIPSIAFKHSFALLTVLIEAARPGRDDCERWLSFGTIWRFGICETDFNGADPDHRLHLTPRALFAASQAP